MPQSDEFSAYVQDLLTGSYDCVDRISLRGYFPLGQASGGMITWWNQLRPQTPISQKALRAMAGDFGRRVHAFAEKNQLPLEHFELGDKSKHARAEELRPSAPDFKGLFAIFVARAPGLVWQIKNNRDGKPVLRRPKKWPLINHYHFHIIDPDWGHLNIKVSGHPPFGLQISLNGHEWVSRRAEAEGIPWQREGNCFVGGDLPRLCQVATALDGPQGLADLQRICERWVYSTCLCFGLRMDEQQRSGFHYRYSCSQLEYSRNLHFKSGRQLDEVYQGLIDRTRRLLDVRRLKTIFGRKGRPHYKPRGGGRLEKVLLQPHHDLSVFKLHFGKLTLKLYDKGPRTLRVEVIVNNITELRCGKSLEKLPGMLARLERMVVEFMDTVQAAHLSFIDGQTLDTLAEASRKGSRRVAGVDLQKPRMRKVAEALIALGAQPEGFTSRELAAKVKEIGGRGSGRYNARKAAYDLRKLRGKALVRVVKGRRRWQLSAKGLGTLVGWILIREKVLKPVLSGLAPKHRRGRPPKTVHPVDVHYQNLQNEMLATLQTLKLAA